jgi:ankyrin repeat protein
MMAVSSGSLDIVKVLIENGADVNAVDQMGILKGGSPLIAAATLEA